MFRLNTLSVICNKQTHMLQKCHEHHYITDLMGPNRLLQQHLKAPIMEMNSMEIIVFRFFGNSILSGSLELLDALQVLALDGDGVGHLVGGGHLTDRLQPRSHCHPSHRYHVGH